jgi:hypothetical protein
LLSTQKLRIQYLSINFAVTVKIKTYNNDNKKNKIMGVRLMIVATVVAIIIKIIQLLKK